MPAKINLLNQTFGNLIVIEEMTKRKNNSVVWKCQCSCGKTLELSTKELRTEGITSCKDCALPRAPRNDLTKNIIGEKFSNLLVLSPTEKRSGGKILYKCKCDCGKETFATRTDLQSGEVKSCGCSKYQLKIGEIINNRKIIGYGHSVQSKTTHYHLYECECLLCHNKYFASKQTLDKTISCGCQKSIGEYNIIQTLINSNIEFKREFVFEGSKYRFDFALFDKNHNVFKLIEFDGEQHYENNIKNSGWNNYQKYEYTLQNDLQKNKLAKELGIPLIRIPYWERDNINLELLLSNKYEI